MHLRNCVDVFAPAVCSDASAKTEHRPVQVHIPPSLSIYLSLSLSRPPYNEPYMISSTSRLYNPDRGLLCSPERIAVYIIIAAVSSSDSEYYEIKLHHKIN